MARLRPDPTEIHVLAQERALPGDSIRLRVLVRDGRASDVVVPGAEVTARWIGGGGETAQGRTEADGVAEIVMPVPETRNKRETLTCRVSARGPTGRNRVEATVRLGPAPKKEEPDFPEPAQAPDAGLRVELVPESGELVRNVENVVWVRTTAAHGRPVPAVVITGGASRVETDGNGLGSFRITPSGGSDSVERLTVSARDVTGRERNEAHELPVGTRAAGLLVRPTQGEVPSGHPVEVELGTSSRATRAFVDWVLDGRVVGTATVPLADRRGRAETVLEAGTEGWVRVEARVFPGTGDLLTDVRWIRVVPKGGGTSPVDPGALGLRLAEASGRETAGVAARGTTYRERSERWTARTEVARRSRLGWLGWLPFACSAAAGIGTLVSALSRRDADRNEAGRGGQAAARVGTGLASGAAALAGIAGFVPPGVGQVVAMILTTVIGTVGVAVGSRDLRDVPGERSLRPGLRRAAGLAPVTFAGSGLAWLGTEWAVRAGAQGVGAGPGDWAMVTVSGAALTWLWCRFKG